MTSGRPPSMRLTPLFLAASLIALLLAVVPTALRAETGAGSCVASWSLQSAGESRSAAVDTLPPEEELQAEGTLLSSEPGFSSDPDLTAASGATAASSTRRSESSPGDFWAPRKRRPVPDIETLERRGAVIGDIVIRAGDIFDADNPEENNRLFLLANRLHRRTRNHVIEQHLLFQPGQPFNAYRLAESERILRSQEYLYDARIEPVAYEDNRVDLEVITRDVWTLKLGLSLSRSGGENSSKFELQDTNFLGTGKEVTLKQLENVDRTSTLARFRDPNILGTRAELELVYSDNSDGHFQKVEIDRPFFSLESRWAAGGQWVENDRVDSLYRLGSISGQFRHEETFFEVGGGVSRGLQDGRSRRLLAGFTYEEHRFGLPLVGGNGAPMVSGLEDRTLAYPWVGFELVDDHFLETKNLNHMSRTEDLHLGHQLRARLGFSSASFGGDKDLGILESQYSWARQSENDSLWVFDSHLSGRWNGDREENLMMGARLSYYRRTFGKHLLYASAGFELAEELDPERQLLLGGDSGLRGYPLRYQSGDRRALLTLEHRFFTDWHPFRLAYVGAALFVDVGAAWSTGEKLESELGVLTNLGVGLRVSPSRSGFGSMLHIDVAFPLSGDASIDRVQWLVSSKESF